MKKRFIIFFSTLLIFSSLSAEKRLFSFSAGLLSGFPVYGKNSVISTGTEIEKGNRVIIGPKQVTNKY